MKRRRITVGFYHERGKTKPITKSAGRREKIVRHPKRFNNISPSNRVTQIAKSEFNLLKKYSRRIVLAGSIRRRKPNPSDIDFVIIPKNVKAKAAIYEHASKYKIRARGEQLLSYWRLPSKKCQVDIYFAEPQYYGCLSGDTIIPLVDGSSRTIKDISENFEQNMFVYAFDTDKEQVNIARVMAAEKTGENVRLIEVKLDNGQKIHCTAHHPFLLSDGSFKSAYALKLGTSLMPLYMTEDRLGYPVILENGWKAIYVHRLVMERYKGIKQPKHGFITHHNDFNPRNNVPDNLDLRSAKSHFHLHQKLGHLKQFRSAQRAYITSVEGRKQSAINMKKAQDAFITKLRTDSNFEKSFKEKAGARLKEYWDNVRKNPELGESHIQSFLNSPLWQNEHRRVQIDKWKRDLYRKWVEEVWRDPKTGRYRSSDNPDFIGFKTWLEQKKLNHKVVAINRLNIFSDVYDLQLSKFHIFALGSGVFVHNSMIMFATGPGEYNIALRAKAIAQGLKLNQYGVFKDNRRVGKATTEREVYDALMYPYKSPELRGLSEKEAEQRFGVKPGQRVLRGGGKAKGCPKHWAEPYEKVVYHDDDFVIIEYPAAKKGKFGHQVIPITKDYKRLDDWEICPEPYSLEAAKRLMERTRKAVQAYKREK